MEDTVVPLSTASLQKFNVRKAGLNPLHPHAEMFGVIRGGRVVAFGGLYMRNKTCWLCSDYTVPSFRRQGLHWALLQWRIQRARDMGATVVCASPLEPSLANFVKAGFVIGRKYSKAAGSASRARLELTQK